MIRNFTDHAANERTFLAWVRTCLAIAGFGVAAARFGVGRRFGVALGIILVVIACVLLLAASWRFVRDSRAIEDDTRQRAGGVGGELALTGLLALVIVVFGLLLWFASA